MLSVSKVLRLQTVANAAVLLAAAMKPTLPLVTALMLAQLTF